MQKHAHNWKGRLLILGPLLITTIVVILILLPGGNSARDPERRPGHDPRRLELTDFKRVVRTTDTTEPEAVIQGERAVLKGQDLYLIHKPTVVSLVETIENPEDNTNVSIKNARLTARSAEFDEAAGVVRLFDSVKAEGEDFEATTANATYLVAKHSLTTDAAVQLKRYRLLPDGGKELAVNITGDGLQADLTLRRIEVSQSPVTTLLNVSEDVFQNSQGLQKPADGAVEVGERRDLVITSDGPLIYEHLARKIAFSDSVVADYGAIRLTCNDLEIVLAKDDKSGGLQIATITAQGNVVFRHRDEAAGTEQVARGDRLVWSNLDQTAKVVGDPARLSRPDIRMSAKRITFFKVDVRFQTESPGELAYEPAKRERVLPEASDDERKPIPAMPIGPGEPVHISWEKGMRYDAGELFAVFSGEVRALQGEADVLECAELELRFAEDDNGRRSIDSVTATGDVRAEQAVAGERRNLTCQRAVWSARTGTVDLQAGNDHPVIISSRAQRLTASQATFEAGGNMLSCAGPGELILTAGTGRSGDADAEPILVRWQKSMAFRTGDASYAEFHGAVVAYRRGEKITGEGVHVEFDNDMNPVKIRATGQAMLEVRSAPAEPSGASPEPKEPPVAPPDEGPDLFGMPTFAGHLTQWRISSEVIVAEPPKQMLSAPAAGTLEVLRSDGEGDLLRWRDRMTINQGERYAQFDGDVNGRFSGSTIRCERTLRLNFNEQRELRHIHAEGDVAFQTAGETPWALSAREVEAIFAADNVLDQVIARRDVSVKDQERSLASQMLHLYFVLAPEADQAELDRATATEQVVLTYGGADPLRAECRQLQWYKKTDQYMLVGEPAKITRLGVTQQGNEIFIDRRTGTMRLPGGGKTSIETPEL